MITVLMTITIFITCKDWGKEGVKTRVREHRPAQRQARQANGKRENRYVIKVMRMRYKSDEVNFSPIG